MYRSSFATFAAPLVSYYLTAFGASIAAGVALILFASLSTAVAPLLAPPDAPVVVVSPAAAAARLKTAAWPAQPDAGQAPAAAPAPPPPPGASPPMFAPALQLPPPPPPPLPSAAVAEWKGRAEVYV